MVSLSLYSDPAIDWEELRFHYDTCKDIYGNNDQDVDEQHVPPHKAAGDLFLKLGKILASKEPPTCAPTGSSDVGAGGNRFDSARPGSGSGSGSSRPGSGGSRPGSDSGSDSDHPGSGGSRPGSGSGRPGSGSGSDSDRPGSGGSRPGSGSVSESGRPDTGSGRPSFNRG